MRSGTFITVVAVLGLSGRLQADFNYNSTSQMTGGSLFKMMSMVSKKATAPTATSVSVKGNRMANKAANMSNIIDLDKETITNVNFDKKTYSTMTFAEMKEMMEKNAAKMQGKQKGEMDFKVSSKETGQTRSINGHDTKEVLMTIDMNMTSAEQGGASGAMQMKSDMWIASSIEGYQEMRDFQMRMAQKIDFMPFGSTVGGRPEMAKGMSELYKAGAKMDGLPMMQVIRMTGALAGMPASSGSSASPSTSDAIASALGGRFGLGGKKKNQDTAEAPGSGSPDALIEITQTVNSFSNSAVDASVFEVPEGFKLVKEGGR